MGRYPILLAIALATAIPIRAEQPLDEIEKKFASIQSFAASFSQTTAPAAGDTQHFEGTLALLRPAKLRMEVSSPVKQSIVYNGERAWLYLPEENTCYLYAAQHIGSLARMPAYVFDPFDELTVDTSYTVDTCLVVSFSAPEEDPFIETIDLTVSKRTLLPCKLLVRDRAGTSISYSFSSLIINTVEPDHFIFTPPESAKIIEP